MVLVMVKTNKINTFREHNAQMNEDSSIEGFGFVYATQRKKEKKEKEPRDIWMTRGKRFAVFRLGP